jgi:hypothetical protein
LLAINSGGGQLEVIDGGGGQAEVLDKVNQVRFLYDARNVDVSFSEELFELLDAQPGCHAACKVLSTGAL